MKNNNSPLEHSLAANNTTQLGNNNSQKTEELHLTEEEFSSTDKDLHSTEDDIYFKWISATSYNSDSANQFTNELDNNVTSSQVFDNEINFQTGQTRNKPKQYMSEFSDLIWTDEEFNQFLFKRQIPPKNDALPMNIKPLSDINLSQKQYIPPMDIVRPELYRRGGILSEIILPLDVSSTHLNVDPKSQVYERVFTIIPDPSLNGISNRYQKSTLVSADARKKDLEIPLVKVHNKRRGISVIIKFPDNCFLKVLHMTRKSKIYRAQSFCKLRSAKRMIVDSTYLFKRYLQKQEDLKPKSSKTPSRIRLEDVSRQLEFPLFSPKMISDLLSTILNIFVSLWVPEYPIIPITFKLTTLEVKNYVTELLPVIQVYFPLMTYQILNNIIRRAYDRNRLELRRKFKRKYENTMLSGKMKENAKK